MLYDPILDYQTGRRSGGVKKETKGEGDRLKEEEAGEGEGSPNPLLFALPRWRLIKTIKPASVAFGHTCTAGY